MYMYTWSILLTHLVCILSIDKKRKKHKEGGGDGGEDPNNEDDEEDSLDDEEENDMNALFGDDEMDEDKDEGEAQEVPFEDRYVEFTDKKGSKFYLPIRKALDIPIVQPGQMCYYSSFHIC